MIFTPARPKPAIVGRLRKLHRESAVEALARAKAMPWAAKVQGEPHAIRGWWCFRGAA